MKKIKYLTILIIMLILIPKSVLAVGNIVVSTSNINIVKGNSSSFIITANNSAGRIDISSSDSNIVNISNSSIFLDMQSETINVVGNEVGNASIKVYVADGTTYDDEDLTGKTYVINVNVVEPTNNKNNKPNNNLSKNNKLKEIKVEGYDLTKIDDNTYSLEVGNDVSTVNISAIAEDTKSKINGIGNHEIIIGENTIEIVVTSEAGTKNKYIIKILRKDGYYLEDLDKLLENNILNEFDININKETKISIEEMTKIKNSGKLIKLNYFDDNKKLIYSWIIDGKKVEKECEFSTSITYISDYVKEISSLSNYADGLYVNFIHNGYLPKGIKVKLYVGDKFENGSYINVYNYNKDNNILELYKDNLEVNSEYIELDIEQCSEYFITMSTISKETYNNSTFNIYMIISIIEVIIIIILFFIIKRNKKYKKANANLEMPKIINNDY